MSEYSLDARHILCPLPVIRTQDRVAELAPGDTLRVTCTDPGALSDIPAWCRINGHEIIACEDNDDEVTVTVRVC